jgi:ubiquinone/menaquinone biosynthesis C-methylase UbiE
MLRAAKRAAAAAGLNIRFIETAIEDLHATKNSFDLITVGRALHWLQPQKTVATFDNIVEPGGHIAV